MKLKVFAVPATGDENAESALNLFMAQHRVLQVDRQLIQNGSASFCAAAAGSTMPVTAARLTVTGKSRLTATTTLAFALPSSTSRWTPSGRPALYPVRGGYPWRTVVTRRVLVVVAKAHGGI